MAFTRKGEAHNGMAEEQQRVARQRNSVTQTRAEGQRLCGALTCTASATIGTAKHCGGLDVYCFATEKRFIAKELHRTARQRKSMDQQRNGIAQHGIAQNCAAQGIGFEKLRIATELHRTALRRYGTALISSARETPRITAKSNERGA